jgi:DtxR family transcriptional regulator, manganese transport regulator
MFVNCLLLCHEEWMTSKGGSPRRGLPAPPPKRPAPPLNDRELAANQRRTRQQHAQERAQDYVEGIADLISAFGEARVTDLAKLLGVSHVTVIRTIERLQREGLVTTQPYRSIFLTDTGRKLAAKAKARHETVVAFLKALGVSSSVARADAEGIEHHVSSETLAAFERFLEGKRK